MLRSSRAEGVSRVDEDLFEGITLDSLHILIGKAKIKYTDAGIYNQIFHYMKRKDLEVSFHSWLKHSYDLSFREELTPAIIELWERKLLEKQKSVLYAEALRIRTIEGSGITFYGVCENGKLMYITSTSKGTRFKTDLINYLRYHPNSKRICKTKGLEGVLSKSDVALRNEINDCLELDLIPVVDHLPVLSNNPNIPALAQYNLNIGDKTAPTPAWDNFIGSLKNNGSRECFMAFVYSIFKDDNFGRQVLWLCGRGNTGKSVVARTISRRLEDLNPMITTSLPLSFHMDKYTTSSLTQKRLIIVPDTIQRALIRLGLIKNITGNDNVTIRKMNKPQTSENIYSKIIATSNKKPFVNVEMEEELSRILYIEIDNSSAFTLRNKWDTVTHGNWNTLLYTEIDDFIAKCKEHYDALLSVDGHNLKVYPTMVDEVETGEFFIKRDLKLWWDNCVAKYEGKNKSSPLTLNEMVTDYNRFCYPANKTGKYTRTIMGFMCTMFRTKGIEIYDLGINNEIFIDQYVLKPKRKQITATTILEERKDKIAKEGNYQEAVYARI